MYKSILFLLSLLGTLILGACTQPLPTAEELAQRMEAARAAMTSAEATLSINFRTPEQSATLSALGWMEQTGQRDSAGEPITRMRTEVSAASEAELLGMTMVSDGSNFWLYSPAEQRVITGSRDELKERTQTNPAAPATMLSEMINQGLEAVDLKVVGTERIAGRPTWKVNFTPRPETSAQLGLNGVINGTLWVDEELALPLKLTLDAGDLGQGTVELSNLQVNQPIDPKRFSFTPPPGVTVEEAADLAEQMRDRAAASLEEARAAVDFSLREPGYLPAGLSLVEVRLLDQRTVILNYVGSAMSLSIVQSRDDLVRDREPPVDSKVESVTVNGLPATLITGERGQGSMLRWEDQGVYFIVTGTLSGEATLKVAAALR